MTARDVRLVAAMSVTRTAEGTERDREGTWSSLVGCLFVMQEVASSNLVVPANLLKEDVMTHPNAIPHDTFHEDDDDLPEFREARKTAITEAVQIPHPFTVESPEGTMKGTAGDYLMRGEYGELYVCAEEIFEETYERCDE